MSRFVRALSVVALASTSTLAQAQQPAATLPAQPGQVQPVQPGQTQPGQTQLGRPGQVQRGQVQPGQAGHAGVHSQGVSLNAFIAHKLKRGNEAEVELGQMAVDKAKHDSVKGFAQMMVKSHQEMIQKLDQFDQTASTGATRSGANAERSGDNATPAARNPGAVDGARNNVRNSESNTDGEARRDDQRTTPGESQASSTSGTPQTSATPNQAGQPARGQIPGQAGANQAGPAQGRMGSMTGNVPHMLVALTDQSCDNELQLTKKMLEKHEGDNFEMAYIGQQIVAHTCMLAQLQALKDSGPQELQQLATQGEQTTRQHLDKAMKIAEELGSEKK